MHSVGHLASKLSKKIEDSVSKRISSYMNESAGEGSINQSQQPNYLHPSPNQPGGPSSWSPGRTPRKIEIADVQVLNNVKSINTRVVRDLGFQGRLGDHVLITYGDTMFRDENWSDRFIGMTGNSVSLASPDPSAVYDPLLNQDGFPKFFLEPTADYGENGGEYSLGLTNVVELEPGRGILYFLLNYRKVVESDIRGAGVAEVRVDRDASGQIVPIATRRCKWWWDGETEPWYGDVCSVKFNNYIYALGHKRDNPWVYITRAPEREAFNLDAYEYWNGTNWQRERLFSPALGEKESIMWMITQGQIFWSEYHGCLVFVYCDAWWTDQVLIRTATTPEGPWSEPQTVYKAKRAKPDGSIYCAIPHPYFDASGKTLVITYTNIPAIVEAIKVTFT